jgi:hypothetical protein
MKDSWQVLGIERTSDTRGIRRAYAARLKTIDQVKDRVGFEELRGAYENCLDQAAYGEYENVSMQEFEVAEEFPQAASPPPVPPVTQQDEPSEEIPVPAPPDIPEFIREDADEITALIAARKHSDFAAALRRVAANPEYISLSHRDQLQDLLLEFICRDETAISGYFFEKLVEEFHWQYPFRPRTGREFMLITAYEKAEGAEVGRIETVVVEEKVYNKFNKNWLWLVFGIGMLGRAFFWNSGSNAPVSPELAALAECSVENSNEIIAPAKEHKTYKRYKEIFEMAKDVKFCRFKGARMSYVHYELLVRKKIQPVSLSQCSDFTPVFSPDSGGTKQTNEALIRRGKPPADLLCIGDADELIDIGSYFRKARVP